MIAALRRRLAADDGLTLVEMLVSLGILAVALSALASTMMSSLIAVRRDESRARATHLATQVLEDLRAMEWDELGVFADDAGYAATYTGDGCPASPCPTVTLAANRAGHAAEGAAPVPGPITVTSVDGREYVRTVDVFWVDDPNEDYKAFRVSLAWDHGGEPRSYVATGARIPTLDEVPLASATPSPTPTTGCPTPVIDFSVSPTVVTLGSSGFTEEDVVITVETCADATSVTVEAGGYGAVPLTQIASDPETWRHTIASGNGSFTPGDTPFNLTVAGSFATQTQSLMVTFVEPDDLPVVILDPMVLSPAAPICVGAGNSTTAAVTLTVQVQGLQGGGQLTLTWTNRNQTGTATSSTPVSVTSTSATYVLTIPSGTQIKSDPTTLAVTARRTSDSETATDDLSADVASC